MQKEIVIYTDGSSKGNPGPGGWGVVIYADDEVHLSRKYKNTTNNEMEVKALYNALKFVKYEFPDNSFTVYTDSDYVFKSFNVWAERWESNNWRTKKGACKHGKVWRKILNLKRDMNIKVKWVKAHSGIEGNEMANRLAGGM